MLFKASAPGSLMLLGEYAVLHGEYAVVSAVNRRMTVTLSPRTDHVITITSALGTYQTNLSQLEIAAPFQFVLASLIKFKNKLKYGCDIVIESEFSHQIGFASSAAVTVAMVAALFNWLNIPYSETELVKYSRDIVRTVQGVGSGADVAACVLGGIVAYCAEPFSIEKLNHTYPISVMYSGSKTPTIEAISTVQKKFSDQPALYKQLIGSIGICARDGIAAIKNQDWQSLGKVMDLQQGLMNELGVNTDALNHNINELRSQPGILGAKISGSGLGDCVVGLGTHDHVSLDIVISQQGVQCEKI
jgi:mevalonate kinase